MIIDRRTIVSAAALAIPLTSTIVRAASAATSAGPDLSTVRTFKQFSDLVVGRADLSRAASEVAVGKLARADAKEFAELEFMEARTVLQILQDLGTPAPAMSTETTSALHSITGAAEGSVFDKAYMTAEYQNHVFLKDLAAAYLQNSDASSESAEERHGRHVAELALFAFTEHVVITRRIVGQLTS